ncbi:DUF5455 family protein [Providencia alcalifaciens]
MPLIIQGIVSLVTVLLSFFVRILKPVFVILKKLALFLVIGLVFISLTLSFFSFISGFLNDVVSHLPDSMRDSMALFLPENTTPAIIAIFVLRVSVFIWSVKNRILDFIR